ncbi:hypothetical protein OAI07_01355 [Akkermansiaceae bacterium]|nr:hypothetical protein [Akkermansiaceae bacterium]
MVSIESSEKRIGDPYFTGVSNGDPCVVECSMEEPVDDAGNFPLVRVGKVFRTVNKFLYLLVRYNGINGLALIQKFDFEINSAAISSKTGNLWVAESISDSNGNKKIIEIETETYEIVSTFVVNIAEDTFSAVIDPKTDRYYINGKPDKFYIIDLEQRELVGTLEYDDVPLAADWAYDIVTERAWMISFGELYSVDLNSGGINKYPIAFDGDTSGIFIGAFTDANGDGFFVDINGRMFTFNIKDYIELRDITVTELLVYDNDHDSEDGASDPTKLNILSR